MYFDGKLNVKKIKKLKSIKLNKDEVLKYVDIDELLLYEKDSWYCVDNKVSFFKKREDARLYGECLSQDIFEAMNMESAKYQIVYLNQRLGLLSPNFQNIKEYHYYDLFNLYKVLPGMNKGYNNFTIKNLLETISYQNWSNKNEIIQELIDRYVGEWVTHQSDGNPRNLMFTFHEKTKEVNIAPSFDRERCFGIQKTFNPDICNSIWIPSIPYEDLKFKQKPYRIDNGLDANILALYLDYKEETINAFERVFSVNYEDILKKYSSSLYQFTLSDETIDYLYNVVESKRIQKNKIMKI